MASAGNDRFLLMFTPEQWTPLEQFIRFMGPPFPVNRPLSHSVRSCDSHIRKFKILANLANRLYPGIDEDLAELKENGYTSNARSNEYSAVVETLACELYAALDCLRTTLYHIYRNVQGIQNSSTKKLFDKAISSSYGVGFPETIRLLLSQAADDWFPKLRKLRTELTHGGTGSCHKDKVSTQIRYIHEGLGDGYRAYIIDNIHSEINAFASGTLNLIYSIFQQLYNQLDPSDTTQFCGIYKGRVYSRTAIPEQPPTQSMGTCTAYSWFNNEPDLACPLREECGAYKRAHARS
jgi:hypothetical protein